GDGPQRQGAAWRGDLDLEERRAAVALAIALGLLQGIEDEGHRSPAMMISIDCGQQRRVGSAERAGDGNLRAHTRDAVDGELMAALKVAHECAELGVEQVADRS